jgi:hypothetical protein
MNLEQQVCSLELAKRLKKLGVKQQSLFWYEQVKIAGRNEWKKEWELCFNNNSSPFSNDHIASAFTVAELGEMLPIQISTGNGLHGITSELLSIQKGTFSKGLEWQVMYYDVQFYNAPSEADARAMMLAYLIDNKFITLNDHLPEGNDADSIL